MMLKKIMLGGAILAQSLFAQELKVMDTKYGETVGLALNDNNQAIVEVRNANPNQLLYWDIVSDEVVEIKTLKGYISAIGRAINNDGAVSGFASKAVAPHHWAFVWTKESGTVALPGYQKDDSSNALGMNKNQIVGFTQYTQVNATHARPVVWTKMGDKWVVEALPLTAKERPIVALARCISPNGKYIGGTEDGVPVVWVRNENTWQLTKPFEGVKGEQQSKVEIDSQKDYASIYQINDEGIFVGQLNMMRTENDHSSTVSGREAYIWSPQNKLQKLGYLEGDEDSTAQAFNQDFVVGMSIDDGRDVRSFVKDKNGMVQLDIGDRYWALFAIAVNASGAIMGTALDSEDGDEALSQAFLFKK